MNIQSRQDFLAWITERNYFEEIFFANIQPMPTLPNTGQVPERVSFDIGIPTTIDWTAGEKTLFIFQRVLASGITEWSSSDIDFEPDPIYADRPIEKDKIQKNRHDVEIVLHSMSTGKERIISADWPAGAVDEILIHKKKAK